MLIEETCIDGFLSCGTAGSERRKCTGSRLSTGHGTYIASLEALNSRLHAPSRIGRTAHGLRAIGHCLEPHELIMMGLVRALPEGGEALKKAEAMWLIVEDKVRKHFEAVGAKELEALDDGDLETCRLMVQTYRDDDDAKAKQGAPSKRPAPI